VLETVLEPGGFGSAVLDLNSNSICRWLSVETTFEGELIYRFDDRVMTGKEELEPGGTPPEEQAALIARRLTPGHVPTPARRWTACRGWSRSSTSWRTRSTWRIWRTS
jgi:hypothetical protein